MEQKDEDVNNMKKSRTMRMMVLSSVIAVLAVGSLAIATNMITGLDALPEPAQRNPIVKEAYLFARENPEILEKLPCFCGCVNTGHENNMDCYLGSDGKFTDHASLCGGCTGVTLDAKKLYSEGKSMSEIREFIDDKYGKEEMAMPTPTPPV